MPEPWYPLVADAEAIFHEYSRVKRAHPLAWIGDGREKLEAALAVPQWAALNADADIVDQAALLIIRVAQAHALVDGNKRLAYLLGVTFLRMNEHPLPAEHAIVLAQHIVAALEHTITVSDLAMWLRDVVPTTDRP
jgi:death-on-curing protein